MIALERCRSSARSWASRCDRPPVASRGHQPWRYIANVSTNGPFRSISVGALLVAAVALAACGRTVLDAPVDVTGTAGSATGQGGAPAGTAGTTGDAGAGDGAIAGTAGHTSGGCMPGTTICGGPDTVKICMDRTFVPFTCSMGCVGGACAACEPGTASCTPDNDREVCSDAGILLPPTRCPGSCLNGACVRCIEGTTRCADKGQQTCKGGEWTSAVDCPFVCVSQACGQQPKLVFVTSETFVGGTLGGLAGADVLCNKAAAAGNLPGSYLAWLSDSTGSPVTRFPKDVGPYQLFDGTIIANNWTDLTTGVLRHSIDLTETGGPPPIVMDACSGANVWSNTSASGFLISTDFSCGDWRDPMGRQTVWGSASSPTNWTDVCSAAGDDPSLVCLSAAALFCFQR
jgi:hypothetical protein